MTFEAEPFRSEYMYLSTKTQEYRPAALLSIKEEAFKSSSSAIGINHCEGKKAGLLSKLSNPEKLVFSKSLPSYSHMNEKERTPHWDRV